jgi:hypothetical protein
MTNDDRKFFKWKKILVRSTHTVLVLLITGNLLWKDTGKIRFFYFTGRLRI